MPGKGREPAPRVALTEGVAAVEAPERIEQEADVVDAPRHRSDVGVGGEEIRQIEMRNDAERRLESRDAAAGGGDPDRAAPIGAERERHLSARERRRRASARTAAGRLGIERIEGATEERAVGEGLVAELRGGGLADEDGAFRPKPGNRHRVVFGRGRFEEPRSHRGAHAGAHDEILCGIGQAVQRTAHASRRDLALRLPRGFERLIVGDADECVDAGLALVDAGEHAFHDLDRRDGPALHQGRELARAHSRQSPCSHEYSYSPLFVLDSRLRGSDGRWRQERANVLRISLRATRVVGLPPRVAHSIHRPPSTRRVWPVM